MIYIPPSIFGDSIVINTPLEALYKRSTSKHTIGVSMIMDTINNIIFDSWSTDLCFRLALK